jgi:DNA replication protein DnaC
MDDIINFRKKFFSSDSSFKVKDQKIDECVADFYRKEIESTGRQYIDSAYVRSIIGAVVSWVRGDYKCCFFTGGVGLGKTAMLKAIIKLFDMARDPINIPPLKCRALVYYDATELCEKYVTSEDARYESFNCKLLVIDDLGCEPEVSVSFGNKKKPINEILVARYASRLPTIISSNITPEEFAERYGNRVADRVNETFQFIEYPPHESFRRLR